MTTYTYTARDKSGGIQRGTLTASSKNDAAEIISNKKFIPISILEKKKNGESILTKLKEYTFIPAVEKVVFSRQLSTLLNAGVPMTKSLSILEKQTSNKGMKKIVTDILKQVEGGNSLSSAMKDHEKVFGSIFPNMVHAGEVGGILDKTMDRMADQIEKDHEITSKIRGAMMYPAVIVVAMVGAIIFMMISIIPELGKMFIEMDAELPASTQLLMTISSLLTNYSLIVLAVLIGTFLGIRYINSTVYAFRKRFHFLILHIPILGKAARKVNVIRFSRTLGSLLDSGISIVETLDIIAKATPNIIYKEEIVVIRDQVKNGKTLATIMDGSKNFPVLVSQMISVGEESGMLSEMTIKVANFYEKEVDNMIKNVTSLLEPVLMIMIGGMIGFMMISIITPIYQLTNMF